MNNLLNINYFLILFIPILLISGPFLPDLVVVILFLSSVILYFKNEFLIKQNLKKFIYFFFIFYFISIFSSALSIDKYISLKSSIPYLRYLGLVLITYCLFNYKKDLTEQLGLIIIIIFFIFFIDSILYFLFNFDFPEYKMANDRFSSFFGDEKVLGGYVARLVPFGLIFITSVKNEKTKKYLFSIFFILSSYLILLSGERTALIIFFSQLLIIIIFFPRFRKILLIFLSSIFICMIITIYFFPQVKLSKPIERIVIHSLGQLYFNNQKLSLFSQRHEDHYKTSLNIFKKNFFIGGGNKSFRFMCGLDEYTVKDNVEERFTERAQYNDYLSIMKAEKQAVDVGFTEKKEIFVIYYKNNKKFHSETFFNISKLKDFFNKPLYKDKIKYFDDAKISDKKYLNLNNVYLKKNQKIFLYDGQIYFRDGCNTHPHHIYLQVASENGVINLMIIIALFVYIIIQFIKIYREKYKNKFYDKEVLLLSMIFTYLIPFIPSGNFYNNWLSIFFFLPIGFYFAIKDNLNE